MLENEMFGYKYVIAQDPGGTTGVAVLRYMDDKLPELVYLDQIANGHKGWWSIFGGSVPTEDTVIVSEKWVEHNVKGADREPLVIEGMQYANWQDDIVYQVPALKKLISDDYLKEQNLWTEGKRHQMDALIHALVYLRNQGNEELTESLAGFGEKQIAQPGEADEKSGRGNGEGFGDSLEQAIAELQEGDGSDGEPGEGGLGNKIEDTEPQGDFHGNITEEQMNAITWDENHAVKEHKGKKRVLDTFAGFSSEESEHVTKSLLDD